jgi:hypothetical protein
MAASSAVGSGDAEAERAAGLAVPVTTDVQAARVPESSRTPDALGSHLFRTDGT